MTEEPKRSGFWQSLPGLLTAVAAVITAVVGAIVGIHGISPGPIPPSPIVTPTPSRPDVTSQFTSTTTPNSHQAKIGEDVHTPDWIFQVTRVQQVNEYDERYYQRRERIGPRGENDMLAVIDVRLKNPRQQTQSIILAARDPRNTGLIDSDGHSFQPLDYDVRLRDSEDFTRWEGSVTVLPGALTDFALMFSVPAGITPRFLVFTLPKQTDVTVSLTN
jgi:hypothetical protein